MNHTKGKVEITTALSGELGVRNKSGYICFLPKPTHYPDQDERYKLELQEYTDSAELIAEAFNVTNSTGFTPKQLAEQNAELLESLENFMSYWESDFFELKAKDGRTLAEWITKANKAIQNSK